MHMMQCCQYYQLFVKILIRADQKFSSRRGVDVYWQQLSQHIMWCPCLPNPPGGKVLHSLSGYPTLLTKLLTPLSCPSKLMIRSLLLNVNRLLWVAFSYIANWTVNREAKLYVGHPHPFMTWPSMNISPGRRSWTPYGSRPNSCIVNTRHEAVITTWTHCKRDQTVGRIKYPLVLSPSIDTILRL